ncbi:nucleoside kinase [Pontiella sulfatireligans]|uniref:Uridine kinase n=1 Tax=Pontiella sulfatireligans TaxID=2750658 RepID=A0A6C2USJ6_9BACT|nr:nucleoside kinase [Pontiella sulfatireligans]VGO22923.1 Uridine kinase [Pontiella sulfatireligans]
MTIRTVDELNTIIRNGGIQAYIQQEEEAKKVQVEAIAGEVAKKKNGLKWIWLAGPSSAGKTTFTHQLSNALNRQGIPTHAISLDNYFVNRELTPRNSKGEHDYEHIEAIDLPLLKRHLEKLDNGHTVEMPHFKFLHGRREFRNDIVRLAPGELALIEGIHGLNPRITSFVDPMHALKIYIGARTTLLLAGGERISSTNHRMLRRMIRDHNFRGNLVEKTFSLWPSVRAGEDKWIFPFQPLADHEYNSALGYEISVLKPLVEPLIRALPNTHPGCIKAKELLEFLGLFEAIDKTRVPADSILQEFIETPR